MSYQPLHLKYRPQTFAQLVGQNAIASTLTNAIRLERIAPAYLFAGPRGTGKTSSARILAKSLNCLSNNAPTTTPCGKCEVCRAIACSSSLDVIEIDAASNTGVENIRTLIESAQFTPLLCRYKVYLVDEAHMLSTAALNALLKTLEEPPTRVVFILATTNPERLLPTIISRCQRFDFRRIPIAAIVTHLSEIANKENIDITPDARNMVAQIAQGGLRDAQSLLDQLSLQRVQITVETVRLLVGAVSESEAIALIEASTLENFTALLDITRRLVEKGIEPLTILQSLTNGFRSLLVALVNPTCNDLVTVSNANWEQLCELAKHWNIAALQYTLQQLVAGERQLKNTQVPVLWLEAILLSLSQKTPRTTAETLSPLQLQAAAPVIGSTSLKTNSGSKKHTFTSLAQRKSSTTSGSINSIDTPPQKAAFQQIHQESSSLNSVTNEWKKVWFNTLNYLSPLNKSLLSNHASLIDINESVAIIAISSASLAKIACERLDEIESALSKAIGKSIKVKIEVNK
ncbi:DNA polymerase III subunit gamma/tau [Microcoleus sp. FACHB-831]|uniref:DNA polymerase III subunit gamma/tau n=1 Tax=Microcoleus sp. FACHB-831 TaxID=2692827 RepID=UPI00168972DB|nr:DNA polymerase III subunit gamma/tau [Microcoleus sp. FACHB-831]MBD1921759.1 DNA polymerase III subunit gamma/tau [Microcoleus sp. FACHB-831]